MIHLYLILILNKGTELKDEIPKNFWGHSIDGKRLPAGWIRLFKDFKTLEKRWKTAESTKLTSWLLDCSLGDTAIPHRSIQGWLAKPILRWVIKIQTPLCSDITNPNQVPSSFFNHLSKKTSKNKGRHCRTATDEDLRGNTKGNNSKLLEETGQGDGYRIWQPLSSTNTVPTRRHWRELTDEKMLEKAPERRKWKQRENHCHIKKEHEKPTYLILNIPKMALKGTTDNKTKSQHC